MTPYRVMTPQRARTYVLLFAALSLSVFANVLMFQPRSAGSDGAARSAGGPTANVGIAHSGTVDEVADTVRAVQRELKGLGLYPGHVDGKSSLLTHAAVLAYEQAQVLPMTGQPSQSLLRLLILGPAGSDAAKPAAAGSVVPGSPAERVVKETRKMLVELGYAAGRDDGRLTVELDKAIRAFEADGGSPVTGRITPGLILRLQRSRAAFKPGRR